MKTQLKTLTPLECDKLLRYLQQPRDSKINPRIYHRNYTMALIMLDAGLRVGELVCLRQDQLWIADSPATALIIEKHQAKNKRERIIDLTIRLHDAIEQMHRMWWIKASSPYRSCAFYSTYPTMCLTVRQAHRIIKEAGAKSIGRDIHPHLLRHTFGSRLMRTTSMRVVQELLGHTNISSTQIYTHPNSDDRQKAIDSLNEKE